jgi:type I restriction enzyme S subunit
LDGGVKMAVISIVSKKELECGTRIDAEYYRPEYAKLEEILLASNPLPLKKLVKSIKSFGAYSLMNQVTYQEKGIPFLRAIDIKEGYADFSNVVRITKDAHKLLWKSEIKPRNVLLAMSGSVGNSCVASDKWKYPINSSQDLAKITVADIINPYLLSTFLNSKYGRFQTQRLPVGSIQQHVFLWQIGLIKVPLLTNIQEYIAFQPKYKEMFDRLPSNVYLQLLGKITLYTKGIEVGSSAYTESGILFLRVSNLSKHGIVDDTVNFISKELYNVLREKYEPQQGEILLSKDATPGIAYFLDESVQGIIASGILRLSLIEDIPPYYLELVLNSIFVQLQIEQSVGGSIIKHWKPSQVQKTWIPRLLADREKEISALVQQSHAARREAKTLLEKAKRAVEIAIEYGEQQAMDFLCK